MTVEEKENVPAAAQEIKNEISQVDDNQNAAQAAAPESLLLSIHFPTRTSSNSEDSVIKVQVLKTTMIQDIRQHIYDSQFDQFLTCFHISSCLNGLGKLRRRQHDH